MLQEGRKSQGGESSRIVEDAELGTNLGTKLKRPDSFEGISGARAALPQNCPRCVEYVFRDLEASNLK
jgi:hypothetical protein